MNGIIIINKPKNCTSHDIVYKIKKIVNEKVGHTGTLDPNATGVLPLLIGKGTEISKYLINHDKTYEAVIQLGEKRDTADVEGQVIQKKEVQASTLENEKVKKILESFIGKKLQTPPIYSAIKVKGKKLYEYARKGENVEIEPRKINIYNIELIKIDQINKTIEFRVHCSKGTYIRTLCEDISEKLENIGYMKQLKRTQVGEFKIEDSVQIEEIKSKEEAEKYLITLEKYFSNKEDIKLKEITPFLNGVQISYNLPDDLYKIYNQEEKFIGIGIIKNKLLKRDIII